LRGSCWKREYGGTAPSANSSPDWREGQPLTDACQSFDLLAGPSP